MSRSRMAWMIVALALSLPALGLWAQNRKPAKRAKLPEFNESQTSRIFFTDAFAKAEGERPANPNASAAPTAAPGAPGGTASEAAVSAYAWSKIISSTTIEDEVKAIKFSADTNVKTPTDFAGRGYKVVRRDFSMLAAMFAIINEYDGDVRWKKDAAAARDLFARTASNAKAGGNINVYNEAKKRRDDLLDLLNGSSLAAKAEEQANNWEHIVDRSPVMQRLETAAEKNLAPWTSSKGEFSSNIEQVLHEAEIVAALSEVLTREGMTDADDDDYVAYARLMKTSALDVVAAVKLNNDEQARKATGEIAKACSDCHDNYR